MHDIKKLTEGLLELQRKYANTFRVMNTEERYARLVVSGALREYSYEHETLREPLIEHVGHLPVIAAYLHPHIAHKDEVDLGRALTMLSVHDIGETEVGDVLAYAKTGEHAHAEEEAARALLPDYLYKFLEEYEARETNDAKFAKSIDSAAPILHELSLPAEVTRERFRVHQFGIADIIKKKQPHFEWDAVLAALFDDMIARYRGLGL